MKRSGTRSLPVIGRRLEHAIRVARSGSRVLRTYLEHSLSEEWFEPLEVPRVSIETTNVCNAKCVFCANPVMTRRKQMLDMDAFRKTVDDAARMGVTKLDFNVTIGDPLLDKRLLERARYVRRYPQFDTLGFVTALQWLHLFDIDEFLDAGFTWLGLSITLSGREMYKEFFGVDCYDRMLANLVTLIEANKRRGQPIALGFSIKPTNEPLAEIVRHEDFRRIDAMVDVDLASCVQSIGSYVDDWGGAVELPEYLKKRPLIPRWFRPCRFLNSTMMVYSNGNVGPCNCRDYEANSELILGNVAEDSLADLWRSDKLRSLRENWRKRNAVPGICSTCRHYVY